MFFEKETVDATVFLPRIAAYIDGADNDMVLAFLSDAVQEFARASHALREIVCVPLKPCVQSYKLHFNLPMLEVLSIRAFYRGVNVPYSQFSPVVENDTLYIGKELREQDTEFQIEVEVSVTPPRDTDVYPAELYERWVTPITARTLAFLYLQTGSEWHNPQAAGNQLSLYQRGVHEALREKITRHRPMQVRLMNMRP